MMSSSECEKNHQIKEDCYMKKTSLVIMAAGIGSRFGGGIKQLAPVGPSGEIIMDYSDSLFRKEERNRGEPVRRSLRREI